MTADTCPHCAVSLQGDPIPAEHRVHKPDHDAQVTRYGRCYCLPYGDKTHFSRIISHEIRGVYDGVLFWSCPDCRMAWVRDTHFGPRLRASREHVEAWNKDRAAVAS